MLEFNKAEIIVEIDLITVFGLAVRQLCIEIPIFVELMAQINTRHRVTAIPHPMLGQHRTEIRSLSEIILRTSDHDMCFITVIGMLAW